MYVAQFFVVVFDSEICVKYVSKIKSNILQNLCFFFSSKHANSPYRAAKLISMTKCRTMNKLVANCCCLQLPSHFQNLDYFALQYLLCNYGQRHHLHLYFTKHKAMTRIINVGSKGWARQLTSLDIISLSLILDSFPVSGIFLRGKKKFLDGQNARNIFEDTILSELTGLEPVTLYAIICVRMNEWM